MIDRTLRGLVPSSMRVILVGGGRNANNLVGLFEDVGIIIVGIVDDAPVPTVLGHDVTRLVDHGLANEAAIMTVANPAIRRTLERRVELRDVTWTAYLDPRCVLSPHATIGPGSFIAPFAACADVTVGRHASIMAGVVLGARVKVGDFSSVLPNATVASDATIGSGVIIGMGARIEAGVVIGDDCRVAPNAVVRRDVAPGAIVTSRVSTRVFQRRQRPSIGPDH